MEPLVSVLRSVRPEFSLLRLLSPCAPYLPWTSTPLTLSRIFLHTHLLGPCWWSRICLLMQGIEFNLRLGTKIPHAELQPSAALQLEVAPASFQSSERYPVDSSPEKAKHQEAQTGWNLKAWRLCSRRDTRGLQVYDLTGISASSSPCTTITQGAA